LNGNTMSLDPGNPTLAQLAKSGNTTAASANTTYTDAENLAVLSTANTWVYFVIQNEFFVPHPMHLHGHDFALIGQGQGTFTPSLASSLNFDSPARRDTAMLAAQGYTVIAFQTDNPGAWLLHCHIAWHVSGGLAMQFLERPDEIPAAKYAESDSFESQCSAFNAFDAVAPWPLTGADSGLKRREQTAGYSADVVRRSEKSSKRYHGHNLRRGLGDSHHAHY